MLPTFALEPENIEIIETPVDFKQTLIREIRKSKRRIVLAALYIGPKEADLLNVLREQLAVESQLQVHILIDYFRGTRPDSGTSSCKFLWQLLHQYPDRVKISFYHTPEAKGAFKLVPARFNEGIGLMHMKTYVFDDTLICSGANLSRDYFTNRQDRYVLFKSIRLCDFFDELCLLLGKYSFAMQKNQRLSTPHLFRNTSQFKSRGKMEFEAFLEKWIEISKKSHNLDASTLVSLAIQLPSFWIRKDEQLTRHILGVKNSTIHLASGYFNLPTIYQDLLLKSESKVNILTASPQANGFYNSKGISRYIPNAYSHLEMLFLQRAEKRNRDINIYEYFRPYWTWHAKGIWVDAPNRYMTILGSSNFNYRSLDRDIEAQLLISTTDEGLKARFKTNMNSLYQHTKLIDLATLRDRDKLTPHWIKLLTRTIRKML